MLVVIWATVASAGPPTAIVWSAEEEARLAAGKVVVRPPVSVSDEAIGAVDVSGSADAVWAAVFDFPARVAELGALDSAVVYAPASDPAGLGVEFTLSVFGTDIVFSTRYVCDYGSGWCTYGLDPARPQDLVSVAGSYAVSPAPSGGTRLVYRSRTDSGRSIPGFVRRWLAVDTLTEQLEGIAARSGS